MNKKRVIGALFGLILLIFAIVASNDSSSFSKSFEDILKNADSGDFTVISNEVEDKEETGVLGSIFGLDEEGEEEDLENGGESEEENSEEGYKVVIVVDGDTIDVEIEGKVERLRLIGINTPETVDPRREVECFGKQASENAKDLLLDKFVTLENDETQQERDRYGRLLRYVYLPDGASFNKYMIEEGFAYEYTYGTPYKYQTEFRQAQADAQNQQKGLWNPSACPN